MDILLLKEIWYLTVLNLVISGIPSILKAGYAVAKANHSFKPCYKWNTFNTERGAKWENRYAVLNLVISGIPSILLYLFLLFLSPYFVLNLVISGIPSILLHN